MAQLISKMILAMAIPAAAGAQERVLAHDNFVQVGADSAAPQPYGWQLPPDDAGQWDAVDVDGVSHAFALSTFFPNGLALGRAAASFVHDAAGPIGDAGPAFSVFLNGVVSVGVKHAPAPSIDDLVGFRQNRLVQLVDQPDLFAPRLMAAEPYDGGEACPDDDKNHAVFFYASALDPNADPLAPRRMIITWHQIATADRCAAAPATFQMVVEEQPGATLPEGRSPVRVTYRYGDCGEPTGDAAQTGPRAGMLYDSLGGNGTKRGFEVLGAKEQMFGTANGGLLVEGRSTGASGDPTRVLDYCRASNLGDGAETVGVFSFLLADDGRPEVDEDDDGVPDGVGGRDNCPNLANPYQENHTGEGFGDACNQDIDGDDLPNELDRCDFTASADNGDLDGDGLGDVCDADIDNDGVANRIDNCPREMNPAQIDINSDGAGIRCDTADTNLLQRVVVAFLEAVAEGWVPGQHEVNLIELMQDLPADKVDEYSSFVDALAAANAKPVEEVWSFIGQALSASPAESDAVDLRQAAADAYAVTNNPDLWALYDWSKSTLTLESFLQKHGNIYFGSGE